MVRTPPRVLVADDDAMSLDVMRSRLAAHGYEVVTAGDGEAALAAVREYLPDLLLLDVMMPGLDGMEVCRRVRGDGSLPYFPIVMVTARTDSRDVVAGLNAGADEYLTKPVDHAALMARVRSMLRIKALHDTVQAQTGQLEEQAARLAEWNVTLQQRVEEQLAQLERVGRLRRFLSPQLADLVLSAGGEALLESHRQLVAVLYCDLRGSTAFAEAAEPEEVFRVLREYQRVVGALITRYGATLEGFRGDGMIMFFNDPVPCPDPAAQAVRLALAMRQHLDDLTAGWRRRGHDLGFGVGIAMGYATLGQIGFDDRLDYGSVGVVPSLAARLCDHAAAGQILVSQRVLAEVEGVAEVERLPDLTLKGFHRPVPAYNVLRLTDEDGPDPAGP